MTDTNTFFLNLFPLRGRLTYTRPGAMFYSDVILSKKGKLSNVWLAAHAERQVTKAMVKDTNIVKTVCECG